MSNTPNNMPLASVPTLIGSTEFNQIHELLKTISKSQESSGQHVAECWDEVIKNYSIWEQSFAGAHTSTTNRKLYLYRLLFQAIPNSPLKHDPRLVDVILSEFSKPGDLVQIKLPDGTTGNAKVVRREITERLGVLFTMESREGTCFTHEFFD